MVLSLLPFTLTQNLLLVQSVFYSGGNCHDSFQIKVSAILMDCVSSSSPSKVDFNETLIKSS
jgi:hypothetical protein